MREDAPAEGQHFVLLGKQQQHIYGDNDFSKSRTQFSGPDVACRGRDVMIVPLLTRCRFANGSWSRESADQTSHPAGVKLSAPSDKLTMSLSAN